MAVGAQDAKVLESIVAGIAVDVIELDGDHSIDRASLRPAAELAALRLETGRIEPSVQLVRRFMSTDDQDSFERARNRLDDVLALDVPPLTTKVRRVESKFTDACLDDSIVSARGDEPDLSHRLCVAQ